MAGGMLFPPSYYGDQYTPDEEAEHEAQEALRDALLGGCIEDDENAPCRRCRPCREVLRDWDEAAEAHEDARIRAYESAMWGGV